MLWVLRASVKWLLGFRPCRGEGERSMHAMVGRSTIHDAERGRAFLRESIPRIKQAPGFVSGNWVMLGEDSGTSMLIFESEGAARAAVEQLKANLPPSDVVTIDTIEIGEVVEQ